MGETTYVIDLTPDGRDRYRHRHVLDGREIVEFSIQYESYITAQWRPIVRYDSAHGFAHRDILHPDGTETKVTFHNWDYAQVVTFAERDLKQNWKIYRERYENALKRLKARE